MGAKRMTRMPRMTHEHDANLKHEEHHRLDSDRDRNGDPLARGGKDSKTAFLSGGGTNQPTPCPKF